ncbi:DUF2878 family protein [bacterium]|nr:DUF2878 family protein [bacterium]
MNKSLNLLSFKIGWALCIWAAMLQQPLLSWLCGLGLLTINISVQKKRRRALLKVFVAILLGVCFETLNQHIGFYTFPNHSSFFPPLWLLAFWPVFSLLFIEFLDLFATKPFWFHLLIGFTGGLGYYCGQWANLLVFQSPNSPWLIAFSITWAVQYFLIVKAVSLVERLVFHR